MKYPKHILLDTIYLNDKKQKFLKTYTNYWSPFWNKSFPVYHEALELTLTSTILQRYQHSKCLNVETLLRQTNKPLFNLSRPQDFKIRKPFIPKRLNLLQHKNTFLENLLPLKVKNKATLTDLLFNIHFLRKEFIYTKLKYSRCPQYDIVSGGLAALFSGFIGFLISEKFGIELVDSGDFYIALMYGVILALTLKPLFKIIDKLEPSYNPFSFKHAFTFYKTIFYLFIFNFKKCIPNVSGIIQLTSKLFFK